MDWKNPVRAASKLGHLALALAACGAIGACTTSSEQIRGDVQPLGGDRFRYVSTATMMHPIDSRQGEHFRMKQLVELLQQRGLCPGGHVIESRDPPLFFNKDSRYEYAVRDVTYVGRCKA
jgi:hypothetical protein